MKIIKLIITFLLLTSLTQAKDEKLDEKSIYHFAISSSVGYLSETLLHQVSGLSDAEKIIYATIPVVAVGVAKEFNDKKGERTDVVINIIGAFTGAYLANHLNNNYFFKVEHQTSQHQTKLSMGYRF